MDDKAKFAITIVVVPALLVIFGLILEYAIVQPFGVSGVITLFIIAIIGLMIFEYHFNWLFSRIGLESLRSYLSSWVSSQSSIAQFTVDKTMKILGMSLPPLFVFALASSSYLIDDDLSTKLKLNNSSFWLIPITALSIGLASALPKGYKGLNRTIAIVGSLAIFIQYTHSNSANEGEMLKTLFAIILGEENLSERAFSLIVAFQLLLVWTVSLIILGAGRPPISGLFARKLHSLVGSNEIQSILVNEDEKKFMEIKQDWMNFMLNPVDDYVSYLRDCVPLKFEDLLLTIGYPNTLGIAMLKDVRSALQSDLNAYFNEKYMTIEYTQISLEQCTEIQNSLIALASSDSDSEH